MFKILRYEQVTEKKEEGWRTIKLPVIYPSKNLVSDWMDKYEDKIKKKTVECTIKSWDRYTNRLETDDVEIYVNDIYENKGFIYFVEESGYPNKILGDSIRVKLERKRKYSKEDPYGEEDWD